MMDAFVARLALVPGASLRRPRMFLGAHSRLVFSACVLRVARRSFSRLTVVVALIDLFREFVESLLAAIKLAPPPPLSDKKKFHVDSSLPSHAEILEHG